MQVSVESSGALERKMTIEVPKERVDGEIQDRLKEIAKTAKVDGFRPGKIPMRIIEQQYGESVRTVVVDELIKISYYEALEQEQIQPAGMPNIKPRDPDNANGIEYVATVEVLPEIAPVSFNGVRLEDVKVEITEADIDQMVAILQKQRATWTTVVGKSKSGDRLTVDFEGTIEGEEFAGNSGQNMSINLGDKRMIDGFEEGLVGAKGGDEITLDLTFPEDYINTEIAGRAVQFAVKVHSVERPELAKIDGEFAKIFGIKDGSIDSLRKEIKTNMAYELAQRTRAMLREQVLDKIIENNEMEIPKTLIEDEIQALSQQMRTEQGEEIELSAGIFTEEATRRVHLGLVISEIIKQNDLKADAAKVRAKIDAFAATYEKPEDVVNYYYADEQRLKEFELKITEESVIDWAIGQADIDEVEKSYGEIMWQDNPLI